MELLPAPQTQMERLMEVLRSSYGVYAASPRSTRHHRSKRCAASPRAAARLEKQIYRFSKGDSVTCLRFDLSVPLAKCVALHYAELAFPFRPFPDRKGLSRRARAAGAAPRVLSGRYRRHRRRRAGHHERRRDPRHHLRRLLPPRPASRSASTTAASQTV